MGNIIKTPLEEIVESERYWEVQKKISDEVNVNSDCESNCRQHYINDFLWDLEQNKFTIEDVRPKKTDKKPLHINFP